MAKANRTTSPKDVSTLDLADQISMKLAHLEAYMSMISGEQFEAFKMMNDDLQEQYLWGVSELAFEVKDLFGVLSQQRSSVDSETV